MNKRKAVAIAAVALVVGLVAGNVTTGFAAADAPASAAADGTATAGVGLRLGGAMRDAGGRLLDIVAKLTGTDADDVLAKRQAGASYADIAKDAGVSSDAVVKSALEVRKEVLDSRVEAGTLTREQADAAIARMTDRLNERITATDGTCTGGGAGMGGRGGGRGMRGGCAGTNVQ